MARDYTKYNVSGLGENLNKRQLVFQIVKDYVEKNKPSFDELTAVFKDEIQGSKGFIRKAAKVEDPKRFNTKMPLKIKFGVEVVVSNQWGSKNMDAFLSLAKKLKYKISEEAEAEEIMVNNKSLEGNTNVLLLSDDLVLKDFDPKWAKYLTLKYQNSADCSDEFSRVKIDLENNHIIPLLESNDDYNKKWFGSWESLLSIDNKENYSSSMLLVFSNDKLDDYGEWRVLWHDIIEGLDDGDYPEGVSDSKLDEIFSGTWFSNIHAFVTQNFNNSSNQPQDNKPEEKSVIEETNVGSSSDVSNGVKSYVYIKVYDDNTGNDLKLIQSTIVQTNGEHILSFHLDSDGDGVIDQYRFYDIKTKVYGSNGSPWDFEEFTDEEGEWIEKYKSFEDFGYDSDEISETLYNMRLEFVKKYLNEASQENMLYEAAVPKDKREMLKEEVKHDGVDYFTGNLVFEEGDKSIVPEV